MTIPLPEDRLSGDRVYLRPVVVDDVQGPYGSWLNDPAVTRFLEARLREHNGNDLESYVRDQRAHPGTWLLAIVLIDGDRHIGNVKVGPIDLIHKRADIGILIGETDCWGYGYAREALELVAEAAFARGLHKLTAGAYETNGASIRSFLGAGFEEEARLKEHWFFEGRFVDAVLLRRMNPNEKDPSSP